jgi:ribonuclease J
VRYTIHRGAHEIGGMCIEVAADDGTRVLLDLGMPLVAPDGGEFPRGTPQRSTAELLEEDVLRTIPGLYPSDPAAPDIAGIILTHSHLDHYGLAHHAHPEIPVWGSRGTIAILDVGRVFFPDAELPSDLRTLPDDEVLAIGGLSITAIPVDHAAPDSRALLVEADGQRLLYSGDLRAHGRTRHRFKKMLSDERLKGVDWLLLEGTTLGPSAGTHGLSSEDDVEDSLAALATANPDRMLAVVASGQNLDRLVSCFRAAKKTERLLVIDPYQAYVLHKLAPLSHSIPQFTWDEVRVSFAPGQVDRLKRAGLMDLVYDMRSHGKASSAALAADPGRYLMCARSNYGMTKVLGKIGVERVILVWSMWNGYWKRDGCALREWAEVQGTQVAFIHSGGHAWPNHLHTLAEVIGARQTVWVHTDAEALPTDELNST